MPSTLLDAVEVETIHQFQERLRVLHQVSAELTKAPTVDELCRRAVELGRNELDFDRLSIWMLEDDLQWMRGTYGTDESGQTRDERGDRFQVKDDPLLTALENHTWLTFENDGKLSNSRMEGVGRGWKAMAVLWDGDRCIGCIYTDNLLRQRPATNYDLEILHLLGTTVGHLCTRRRAEEIMLQERLEAALQKEKVELLSEFISTLSHDLKTPLAVIKTSLYLIERLNDPVREKAKLEIIKDQTVRLEKLIEDVLTMSRLEHGGNFTYQPLDVNTLIDEALQLVRADAEAKGHTLTLNLTPGLPRLNGIREELQRAFCKLLENAVNYTPDAGSISIRSYLDDGSLVVDVSDTGIGISAEDMPHIFDRFYRVDVARTAKDGGTGLGLAIVKKIVEMHDGTVHAESQLEKGSCFCVRLPLPSEA